MGQRWDAADWLDAADLFVLPSLAEGMPLAVMEAMAKGLPVMATAVSGIPEELGDLRFEIADFRFTEEGRATGRLLPDPWSGTERLVEELVATILEWAGDAELRKRIGAGCRERALVMFREERMLRQTREVIERALGRDSRFQNADFRFSEIAQK
jgi:glycosyltransferase involved in cell wall biosynthesis